MTSETKPPEEVTAKFRDYDLREGVQQALDDAGYETPTPIQSAAIPPLMQGGDLIGVAETGTGKTLTYLLPILHRMVFDGSKSPQAVVICPTRELAQQVGKEAVKFGRHLGLRTIVAYGGTSTAEQKRLLTEGCELLVATPGRLLDFVNSAWLSLRRVKYLVLDEADRMLDMGFINDMDAILRKMPMSRQSMLFSATISDEVRELAERYMMHPEIVRMSAQTKVAGGVDHALYPVADSQKTDLLLEILRRRRAVKTLVFIATKKGTSELALRLRRDAHEVVSLSSLLSQANRERALKAFRDGEFDVLVATDVAARGLDITDIDLVINYDLPMQSSDYVHRIGRTGRAERHGHAASLVTPRDERKVKEIERLIGEPIARIEFEGFRYRKADPVRDGDRRGRGGGRGRGDGGRPSGGRGGSGRRRSGGSGRPGGSGRSGGSGSSAGRSGESSVAKESRGEGGAPRPRRRRRRRSGSGSGGDSGSGSGSGGSGSGGSGSAE